MFHFKTDLPKGNACQFEEKVPIFSGSTIFYDWENTIPGERVFQQCPDICTELNEYHSEGMIVRECVETESGGAQWQDPDITACEISITALQLCEISQVF